MIFVITEIVCIPTGTSSALKKKTGKESQYIVSRPELGSDPPFESDLESGCDTYGLEKTFHLNPFFKSKYVERTHLYSCVFH